MNRQAVLNGILGFLAGWFATDLLKTQPIISLVILTVYFGTLINNLIPSDYD